MPSDYKSKYLDIRAKFLEASDVAYRLGFENGMKEGEQVAQQQAMAEQQAMEQAAAQGAMPGMEGEMPPGMEGEMPPEEMGMEPGMEPGAEGMEEEGGGSDLDSGIEELSSLVAKGEKPSVISMRKAVGKINDLRKSQKDKWRKKTEKTTSAQKKIVDGVLKKWEDESKDVTGNLENILKEHGVNLED